MSKWMLGMIVYIAGPCEYSNSTFLKGTRMNEQIKQLADNATHYANGVCDADPNADWYETRDQKFAELIVQECAENFTKVWYEQGVDVRGTDIHKFMKRFEEHFGVEE